MYVLGASLFVQMSDYYLWELFFKFLFHQSGINSFYILLSY